MKTRITILLAAVVLAACATTTGVDNIAQLPGGSKIFVVSALGDALVVQHTGITIWGNWESSEDVSDWALDKHVQELIVAKSNEPGRFQLVSADTSDIRASLGEIGLDFWTGNLKAEGGLDSMLAAGREAGADSILLIGKAKIEDTFFYTNQYLHGFGVYQRSVWGGKKAIIFGALRMWLIDVATGEELAATIEIDQRPRDESMWLEEGERMSDAALAETRTSITELIDLIVVQSLVNLTFVDA